MKKPIEKKNNTKNLEPATREDLAQALNNITSTIVASLQEIFSKNITKKDLQAFATKEYLEEKFSLKADLKTLENRLRALEEGVENLEIEMSDNSLEAEFRVYKKDKVLH